MFFSTTLFAGNREIVILSESWCPGCKVLEAGMKDKEVATELKNFKIWRNNDYKGWKVSQIPTIIIVEQNELVGTIEIDRRVGFGGKQGFLEFLRKNK